MSNGLIYVKFLYMTMNHNILFVITTMIFFFLSLIYEQFRFKTSEQKKKKKIEMTKTMFFEFIVCACNMYVMLLVDTN